VNNALHRLAEVSLAEWKQAGDGWTHLPYLARFQAEQLPADWRTFLRGRFAAVLESGRAGSLTLAVPDSPEVKVFQIDGKVMTHTAEAGHESHPEKPLAYLREWAQTHRAPRFSGWPLFQGGLLMALSYELGTQWEPVPTAGHESLAPLAVMWEAPEVCIFNHETKELTVVVLCSVNEDLNQVWCEARARAEGLAQKWSEASRSSSMVFPDSPAPLKVIQESLSDASFQEAVKKVKDYIAAGDTYQVNLSTRLEIPFVDSALVYEAMRQTNPSPYMGYLRFPGGALACGSPELLVEVVAGKIHSRPIAGTRPRGADSVADDAWVAELTQNQKERAEHLMLVDLLRNDVGRVAEPGSVRVPEFMTVERYSHVMHLVSQVEGQLSSRSDLAEVIQALFPGGTITGAPKVRTMQIIAEVEPVARGFYTGSLGWMSASGDLCLNIIIRSLWSASQRCFIQAGAGVVADSDPAQEYAESIRKAQAPHLAAARAAYVSC
jgi:para-aminobenzoate synthetase component 1